MWLLLKKIIGQIDNWGHYFDDYIDTNKQKLGENFDID
jgi:hypothetical protein